MTTNVDAAKALIKLLNRRGFDAFFIGGKSRNDLHNVFHEIQTNITDIDIITNATKEEIKKLFPNAQESPSKALNILLITFAEQKIEIASFIRDNTIYDALKVNYKIINTERLAAGTLDIERSQRDFTMNTIVQDISNQYIDYTYVYHAEDISAMSDVRNGIIRAVGIPDDRFKADPIRIIRMFRFQSQLGYEIEEKTYESAYNNRHLLSSLTKEEINEEFNKLLTGQFVYQTLLNMKKFEFFDIPIEGIPYFQQIKNINEVAFKQLELYNSNTQIQDIIQNYTLLFITSSPQETENTLKTFLPINEEDIQRVMWLIKHQFLLSPKNLPNLLIFYCL